MANEGIDFELPKKIFKNSSHTRGRYVSIILHTDTSITDTLRVSTRIRNKISSEERIRKVPTCWRSKKFHRWGIYTPLRI